MSAQEPLDGRYRWLFPVKDMHGRDATLGIGLDGGQVIVSVPALGWCRLDDPELVEKIGYCLTSASYIARDQRRQGAPTVAAEPAAQLEQLPDAQNSRNSSDSMPRRAS